MRLLLPRVLCALRNGLVRRTTGRHAWREGPVDASHFRSPWDAFILALDLLCLYESAVRHALSSHTLLLSTDQESPSPDSTSASHTPTLTELHHCILLLLQVRDLRHHATPPVFLAARNHIVIAQVSSIIMVYLCNPLLPSRKITTPSHLDTSRYSVQRQPSSKDRRGLDRFSDLRAQTTT